MSGSVIQVEGLSKHYWLDQRPREKYVALRDVLAGAAKGFVRRLSGRGGSTTRDEFWALRDLSFEIPRGEAVAVVGRNGAGKSTLLKILSRIVEPTAGRARIRGRVASLLEVGTGFHPELTGRENIFLNGAILGMRRAEIRRKFDDIVAFAEVERFLDTPVKRYSSGMYVRLAFAVAAFLEPEILVVDEVLAVGDATFQKKCLGKMGEVTAAEGRTVLFVSHNMSAVTQLCRKAIWLKGGKLQAVGDAATIVRDYLAHDAEQVAERTWDWPSDGPRTAPGDDRVRLLVGRVFQDGELSGVIDINRPMEIEVEFQVLRPVRDLIAGCTFTNSLGTCLFNRCDWKPNQLGPGRYRKRLQIPAQVFAEDRVSVLVQLVFYDPDIGSVLQPDILHFETVDSDAESPVRGHFKGVWPGVLRLGLPWADAERIPDPAAP